MKKIYSGLFAAILIVSSFIVLPYMSFAKEKDNKEKDHKPAQIQNNKKDDSNKKPIAPRPTAQNNSTCLKAFGRFFGHNWFNHDNRDQWAENCHIPFGWGKKFHGGNATTTPDVTSPVITNIVSRPAKNQAEVHWTTNEKSDSTIYWSTVSPVDMSSTTNSIVRYNQTRTHQLVIRKLVPGTTYYFVVRSRDAAGNSTVSGTNSFVTKAPSTDTGAPVISSIVSLTGTTSIQVAWKTNENASGRVYFSTVLPVTPNASATSYVDGDALVKDHLITINSLVPNTIYYLVIESTDSAGNVSTSATFSGKTTSAPVAIDTVAPVISAVVTSVGSSTTTISWFTDEVATSKVFYSTSTPINILTAPFVSNGSLVNGHSLDITGLATSTVYRFLVQSVDAANNARTYGEITVTTSSGL